MWTQQRAISILIIATTGFGFLFHAFTTVVSVISPDCPFQTPISLATRERLVLAPAAAPAAVETQYFKLRFKPAAKPNLT
jgi:hypothetical protein